MSPTRLWTERATSRVSLQDIKPQRQRGTKIRPQILNLDFVELHCVRSGFDFSSHRRCPAGSARTHRAGLTAECRSHHHHASISIGTARCGACYETPARELRATRRKMILSRKRPWEPEEEKQLREMAEAGKTITMIALRLKRTVTAVCGRLSILKVSLHKAGRSPKKNPPA
jgi:hypothetical protein